MFSREQLIHVAVVIFTLGLLIGGIASIRCFYDKPAEDTITWLSSDSLLMQLYAQQQDKQPTRPSIHLHPFDPNKTDSVSLIDLGLRPYMAHSLLQYRKKGGSFRQKHDFRKMFFMTDSLYAIYQPLLLLPDTFLTHYDSIRSGLLAKDTITAYTIKKDTVLELNTADSTELMFIKGIGHGIAKAVIFRRTQLGGFYSVKQLKEVECITDSLFALIAPHFIVDTTKITSIPVNTASVRRLMRHPYLRFTQANAIYQLRREKVRLNGIDDLRPLEALSDSDIEHLIPYLSFE